MRVRKPGVALGVVFAFLGACGGGDDDMVTFDAAPPPPDASPPDAAPPDADPCSSCTPTQDCAGTCTCPANPTFGTGDIFDCMDTAMLAPTVLGIDTFSPDGTLIHALVIGFHPTDTPLDTDIDLSTVPAGEAPFVGLGYDINITNRTTRGTFRSTAGTLHLTARSAAGVVGTVSDVQLVEIDPDADPPAALPGGCSFTITSLSFDIAGSACP